MTPYLKAGKTKYTHKQFYYMLEEFVESLSPLTMHCSWQTGQMSNSHRGDETRSRGQFILSTMTGTGSQEVHLAQVLYGGKVVLEVQLSGKKPPCENDIVAALKRALPTKKSIKGNAV